MADPDAVAVAEPTEVPDLGLAVSVDSFSGPLDLLLFLVRKDELDIRDIPLAGIADQFVALVRAWQDRGELDLELAGDFILMAATLLEIKARAIAPPPETDGDEAADDGEDELLDPRQGLIQKLLAYRRFKEAVGLLTHLEEERALRHTRRFREDLPEDPEEADGIDLGALDSGQLFTLWDDLLKRLGGKGPRTVLKDDIPLEATVEKLVEAARAAGTTTLSTLLANEPGLLGRVTLLMATLETARKRVVEARQVEQYGDVNLRFRPEEERTGPPPELPPEVPWRKRQRKPPLVTYTAAVVGDEEEGAEPEPEAPYETDEQRFLRELNERCDLDAVLTRAVDVEAGFLEHWYTLFPDKRPKPPEPEPVVVPVAEVLPAPVVVEAAPAPALEPVAPTPAPEPVPAEVPVAREEPPPVVAEPPPVDTPVVPETPVVAETPMVPVEPSSVAEVPAVEAVATPVESLAVEPAAPAEAAPVAEASPVPEAIAPTEAIASVPEPLMAESPTVETPTLEAAVAEPVPMVVVAESVPVDVVPEAHVDVVAMPAPEPEARASEVAAPEPIPPDVREMLTDVEPTPAVDPITAVVELPTSEPVALAPEALPDTPVTVPEDVAPTPEPEASTLPEVALVAEAEPMAPTADEPVAEVPHEESVVTEDEAVVARELHVEPLVVHAAAVAEVTPESVAEEPVAHAEIPVVAPPEAPAVVEVPPMVEAPRAVVAEILPEPAPAPATDVVPEAAPELVTPSPVTPTAEVTPEVPAPVAVAPEVSLESVVPVTQAAPVPALVDVPPAAPAPVAIARPAPSLLPLLVAATFALAMVGGWWAFRVPPVHPPSATAARPEVVAPVWPAWPPARDWFAVAEPWTLLPPAAFVEPWPPARDWFAVAEPWSFLPSSAFIEPWPPARDWFAVAAPWSFLPEEAFLPAAVPTPAIDLADADLWRRWAGFPVPVIVDELTPIPPFVGTPVVP